MATDSRRENYRKGRQVSTSVTPGEIVTCHVDLAMMHDSAGPSVWRVKKLDEAWVCPIWDLDKLVVITDHYINDDNPSHQEIQKHAQSWSADHDIKHFIKEQGICHIVLPEGGHVKPGMFIVGGDSHSVTGGAFGTFMVWRWRDRNDRCACDG